MASKRGLQQRLNAAVRKREVKPRPQVVPTGNVRNDRWREITKSHFDLLQNIEFGLVDCWYMDDQLDDSAVHTALVAAMRDEPPENTVAHEAFVRLKTIRSLRDVGDELWLDALRVVDQSVRDHSSLRHGDRSYLNFIGAFFESQADHDRSSYLVTHDRIQRPILGASPTGDVVIGFAWYRREQWPLLRSLAADHDELEETYDQWLAVATKALEDLRCQGIRAKKADVDVHELAAWCKKRGCPLDADGRAAFASEKMQ